MSDVISKKCDNCGVVKAEVNGWWKIVAYPHEIKVVEYHWFNMWSQQKQFEFALGGDCFDACGQGCLVGKVGKIVSNLGAENIPRDKGITVDALIAFCEYACEQISEQAAR